LELVRFYLTGADPVERSIPAVVAKGKQVGASMLIVAEGEARLEALDRALWEEFPEEFLAHGRAGEAHEAKQPVLLSERCEAANGARVIALADGRWREEAEAFDRVFLFFDDRQRESVRPVWSSFNQRSDVAREYYAREDGKWVKLL
jgi:DNA polymerase-3 subunit chi